VTLNPDAKRQFGVRRSAEQGPQFIRDATVQARKRPTRCGSMLAVCDSEAARVRTDGMIAVQHAAAMTISWW